MRNKLSTIFVLALFILSVVPTTFAENTDSDTSNVAVSSEDTGDDTTATVSSTAAGTPMPFRKVAVATQKVQAAQKVTAAKAKAVAGSSGVVNINLNKCIATLKSNTKIADPTAVCKKIINNRNKCTALLKESNVANPVKLCTTILLAKAVAVVKDRAYLAKTITNKAAEWKIKKMDKVVQAKPMAQQIISKLPDEKAKLLLNLPRAKQKEILASSENVALEKLKNYKLQKVKKEDLFKKRVIAPTQLKNAEAKYQLAKNRYVEQKGEYIKAKGLFDNSKRALGVCKEDDNSTKCVELRNKIIEHSKKFLEHSANVLINQFTKVKEKINANDDISEEDAAKIIEDIDNAIEKLNDALAKLEEADTKEEIKEIAQTISNIWKAYKHRIRLYAARLINLKIKDIIERSEQLEKKLDCTLTAMEEQGIEVTAIDIKVDLFSMRIDEAKTKYNMAKDLLDKAKELKTDDPTDSEIRTVTSLVAQANKLIKEAHAALKEAYSILTGILRDIKAAGGDITACTADEDLEEDEEYEVIDVTETTPVEEEPETPSEEEPSETVPDEEEPTEEETPVEEPVEEVDLSVIDKPDCWADKPDYRPGVDKGYFIWQGTCANFWWVDWSGDTKALWKRWRNIKANKVTTDDPSIEEVEAVDAAIESGEVATESDELVEDESNEVTGAPVAEQNCTNVACTAAIPVCAEGTVLVKKQKSDQCCPTYKCLEKPKLLYNVRGKITSNGRIFDVGVRKFDGFDKLWVKNNVIHFKARVGPHFDGLFFRTTGDVVEYELWYDGEKTTDLIYIGKDKENPDTNPFKLEGEPAKRPRVCKPGQIIYNKKCVKTIKHRIFKAADVMTTAEAESADSGFVAEYTEE